jgi:hypothetical protein
LNLIVLYAEESINLIPFPLFRIKELFKIRLLSEASNKTPSSLSKQVLFLIVLVSDSNRNIPWIFLKQVLLSIIENAESLIKIPEPFVLLAQ